MTPTQDAARALLAVAPTRTAWDRNAADAMYALIGEVEHLTLRLAYVEGQLAAARHHIRSLEETQ